MCFIQMHNYLLKVGMFMYKNLQYEMMQKGITQEDIATELQIHRNSVANKISGKTPFTIDEVFRICEKFFPNCDMRYLFQRTLQSA